MNPLDFVIETEVGDFPRPKTEVVNLEDWTNFDLAWAAWSACLAGLPYETDIPLSDLEVDLLKESHLDRSPFCIYGLLRAMFPDRESK